MRAYLATFGAVFLLLRRSSAFVDTYNDRIVAEIIETQRRHAVEPNVSWTGWNYNELDRRQDDNRCGPDGASRVCPGATCCSMYGYCGTGPEYCNRFGCRPQFGWCEDQPLPTSTSIPVTTPLPTSSSSSLSSTAISSSSSSVLVSSTSTSALPTFPPAPPAGVTITTNGMCGNTTTCAGATYGRCCSYYFWCGDGDAFCGDGCRSGFGFCNGEPLPSSSSSSTIPAPTTSSSTVSSTISTSSTTSSSLSSSSTTLSISMTSLSSTLSSTTTSTLSTSAPPGPTGGLTLTTNGMCGNGTTCAGSGYGSCCSHFYYCGSSSEFCGDGCRSGFGQCSGVTIPQPPASPISTNGMCGNGTTCAGSTFGGCCSRFYYCGTSSAYCGLNCRPEFGSCT